uniref:Opioid binding protein/cell adhesion molecule-like n=1 Tax=Seriola lalandi dorsalis TaxID=1841481 RepID=A0A3B4XFF1_SERLL
VPARITNISKDITVNEGSNVDLMCLAVGRPEANIIWNNLLEGEHLELTAVTKEESGSYECIASNDISSPDIRTVQVTVNYPPFISKARSTGTPVGQKGVLQCEASAVPRADFEWYKEDRRQVSPLSSVTPTGLELFVVKEDYGNYTCVAMNTMGMTNASIILYGKNKMLVNCVRNYCNLIFKWKAFTLCMLAAVQRKKKKSPTLCYAVLYLFISAIH